MHIFIMSITYLQKAENIHWKLLEELISQSMHYQPLFTWCSHPKMAVKNPVSLSKNIFSASNFFMHIFNMSVKCWKDPVKAIRGVDFTKYVLSTIIY